ncbi:isochorismatase family protein [Devosia sp. FKR38]|uniref:cysteine hydrolase family protein n=1 Tax=Devosia sp. FKR38 TaxID=2562312 RepID=UPI0010C08B1A|nr:isochorismatase family protein [Devosia sp. FKR38]
MSDTALLVIDAQESFRQRPNWFEVDPTTYFARQQALIDGARAKGHRIVRVLHTAPEGIFALASGFVRPLAELVYEPDVTIYKSRHSALVGADLPVWLTQNAIGRLIISGIRTEQCCETTTRHASDMGWSVDFVAEATHTTLLTDATGHTWTVDELKARTAAVLDGRFARVTTVEGALAGPERAAA